MSTINEIKNNTSCSEIADYKKLYFTAMNKLTEIYEAIAEVQRDMEEMYLNQTEPNVRQ